MVGTKGCQNKVGQGYKLYYRQCIILCPTYTARSEYIQFPASMKVTLHCSNKNITPNLLCQQHINFEVGNLCTVLNSHEDSIFSLDGHTDSEPLFSIH